MKPKTNTTMILNINLPPLVTEEEKVKSLWVIAYEVAARHNVTVWEMKKGPREDDLVAARAEFAKEAINNYRQCEIARFLNKNHSSIDHYLKHYQS